MPKSKPAKPSAKKTAKTAPKKAVARPVKALKPAASGPRKKPSAPKQTQTKQTVSNAKPVKATKPDPTTKKATAAKAAPSQVRETTPPPPTAPARSTGTPGRSPGISKARIVPRPELIPEETPEIKGTPGVMTPWLQTQKQRILELYDSIVDSMNGVAKDTLRSRAEGSEASAFGMHQADAGSDAYDRDFALSLLSQEQDALYEIEQALKRIELGTYGICEMSGKEISKARLEAMPFARYTVECQAEIERQGKLQKARMPVTSLFGLTDEEGQEGEEEEQSSDTKE